MKPRTFLPLVIVLFAALALLPQAFGQSTNVKVPNKNQSGKFKSAIFKGAGNQIQSNSIASFIGGGQSNVVVVGVTNAVIGGGFGNFVMDHFGAVFGGVNNTVGGTNSFVGGGRENLSDGDFAAIGGGEKNTASGRYSTVPGGVRCEATHDGSFVWSGWGDGDTVSVQTNSFTVRASGGARFLTTTATNPFGLVGVSLLPSATAWTPLSDRESKTDFQPIEPREVLSKLAAMPVTSWKYKHDPSRRYIGPTSQDFMAAFHLGNYDKGINTLDADGVTFAAIQGLVEELKERDKAIEELQYELRAVKERLNSLPPAP